MNLKKLSLFNYKNFSEANFDFDDKINCFVGKNGIGKTNVLDSIYHLAIGKSYFNPLSTQNIKHGEEFFVIDGVFEKENRTEQIICSYKKAQKLRETLKGNVGADAIDAVENSAAEYPKYLAQAFQASSLPKPKNFIGMQKSVPAPEMEKALSDTVQVSDAEVLNLANRRAQALKDWLAGQDCDRPSLYCRAKAGGHASGGIEP